MSNATEAMFETADRPTPACPSDLTLDRGHLGELSADRAAALEAHFDVCADCRARRDQREAGFEALPVDAAALFARIQAAGPKRPVRDFVGGVLADATTPRPEGSSDAPTLSAPRLAAWARALDALRDFATSWRAPVLVGAAAAIAFALVPAESDTLRTKGDGLGLRVFRERAGQVEEQLSGAEFAARDRLRFEVSAPAGAQIMIVGVEESGDVFTYYPTDADRSARIQRADDGALAGAIELDDYAGREWLHLVSCPDAFAKGDLTLSPGPRGVAAPTGCDVRAFELARSHD